MDRPIRENTKRLNIFLPKDIHYRLKLQASLEETNMTEKIIEWVKEYTEEIGSIQKTI